jgi:integrase/recombinase XerD
MQKLLEKTKNELRLRNYSPKTIKSYLLYVSEYLNFANNKTKESKESVIREYLLNKQEKGMSSQTINLALNAVKYFYREVLKHQDKIDIRFAKRSSKLPVILSRDEIKTILTATKNKKHKLMLSIAYGAGLRISEVINLKVADINTKELTIHIKEAKGKHDRISIIAKKITPELEKNIALKYKNDYLFESNRGGKLHIRSLQKIFEKSLAIAKIQKNATFHSLRHSFATHLLENGTSIRHIQKLLGHKNIRTTQIYTKVTNPTLKNIKSPL